MVKCPQCLQIRDDSDLPCPHCGEVPYGIRNRPSQRIAEEPSKPREEPKMLGFGGAELDLGDASTSGLDLAADDAPTSPVAVAAQPSLPALKLEPLPGSTEPPLQTVARLSPAVGPAPDDGEAKRIADYGEPDPGPIGAVRYWWRVSMRRAELDRRRAEAAEASDGLAHGRQSRFAQLGRAAEADRASNSEPRAGLVRGARAAEARRDQEAHVAATVVSEREKRLAELRARLAGLRSEIAPISESAAGTRKRLDDLKGEARRTESAMKRAEIERRNVVELIAKRQEAFADLSRPAEERGLLLAEIAELDKRSPELNERIDAARVKLEALAQPVAEAQAEHEIAERLLAQKRQVAEEVTERTEEAELELEAEKARSGARFQAINREVEDAWAAVGENVLPTVDRGGSGPLVALARGAAEISAEADEAAQRLSLLERAVACFDHEAFARGKTLAIVGGAVGLVVLTILIVLIIS